MKKRNLKIKVCGMKHLENIQEVAALSSDYLGFIFYPKSPRNFEGEIPEISDTIKKTGVFVNADLDFVVEKVNKYNFKAVQLHGSETADYCLTLKQQVPAIEVFKVFGIKDRFDFSALNAYEGIVDYFLFDTKGKEKGGNGYTFDWNVLKQYKSKTPIILSGGIGIQELNKIEQILKTDLPIYALDLNSKFETEPGLKNTELLKEFINRVQNIEYRI